MAHSLTTIGVHLECAIQTEMVVELELVLSKSRRFRHNSIIMQQSCERVRKCAKVKGRVELECASNLVQFRLLFTKLQHFEKNGT